MKSKSILTIVGIFAIIVSLAFFLNSVPATQVVDSNVVNCANVGDSLELPADGQQSSAENMVWEPTSNGPAPTETCDSTNWGEVSCTNPVDPVRPNDRAIVYQCTNIGTQKNPCYAWVQIRKCDRGVSCDIEEVDCA